MYKTEIICESCDTHFIVVCKEDAPAYCPFCSNPIEVDIEDEE